jgi:hypothetical protein
MTKQNPSLEGTEFKILETGIWKPEYDVITSCGPEFITRKNLKNFSSAPEFV